MTHPLLSHEAAPIAGISLGRFRQLVREGRIKPAAVTPSGTRLFERHVVEEFARQRDAERTRSEA
jgi:hypothetical protein